jgi:hypothetical protein
MIARRRFFGWVSLALLASILAGPARGADPIEIRSVPLPLHGTDPEVQRVGALVYRGGVELGSPDNRFGGWSDLHVSPDGARLTAISDRGHWMDAEIRYDTARRLAGLANARLGPLIDFFGRRLRGLAGDAEGLTLYPDGAWLVSFERRHRLWLYPAADPPFSVRPRLIALPRRAVEMTENGGLEALLRLAGGHLFTLAEATGDDGWNIGWIGDGVRWDELRYRAAPEFNPTGAAQLPPGTDNAGDVLVLERRFNLRDGPGARLALLRRAAIRAGARLTGIEIARLQAPFAIDNFEGIAVIRGRGGETLLFLLSDDNFSFWQRTLLLMFELGAPK